MRNDFTAIYIAAMVVFIILATFASFYVIYLAESGKSVGLMKFSNELGYRIKGFGVLAPIVFIGSYVIASILLLPVLLLTMAGSVLFPPWHAMAYSIFGIWLATILPFLLAKGLLHKHVEKCVHTKYRKYDDILNHLTFGSIVFLRLLPIMPFEIFNYLAGLGRVRLWKYALASLVGIVPWTAINVLFFSSVHETLKTSGLSVAALANFKVGLFLAFNLAVYAGTIGYIWWRYRKHKRSKSFP